MMRLTTSPLRLVASSPAFSNSRNAFLISLWSSFNSTMASLDMALPRLGSARLVPAADRVLTGTPGYMNGGRGSRPLLAITVRRFLGGKFVAISVNLDKGLDKAFEN